MPKNDEKKIFPKTLNAPLGLVIEASSVRIFM